MDQRIEDTLAVLKNTLERKNIDYGNSVLKCPVLCPGVSPRVAILTRISDKIGRLVSIANAKTVHVDESFDDTLFDLAGYIVLYFAAMNEVREMSDTEQED